MTAESEFDREMGKRLPLRILLAEDNSINQQLALRTLERLGYRADVAGNGLEALNALRRQAYDLILMDVQMPEMDGLQATRHIRNEFPSDKQPHIIAITANAMQSDREQCLQAGMDDYISKPFEVQELVNALEQSQPQSRKVAEPQSRPSEIQYPKSEIRNPKSQIPIVLDPAAIKLLQLTLGEKTGTMLPMLIDSFFNSTVELQEQARQGRTEPVGGLIPRQVCFKPIIIMLRTWPCEKSMAVV